MRAEAPSPTAAVQAAQEGAGAAPAWAAPSPPLPRPCMRLPLSAHAQTTFPTSLGSLSTSPDAYAPLGCALVGLAFSAPMHLKLLNETLAGASVAIAALLSVPTARLHDRRGRPTLTNLQGSTPQSLLCYAIGVATATAGLVVLTRSDAAAHDELLDDRR